MEKLREETIRDVRCCLAIAKRSLDIRRLAADYQTYTNQSIQYKQLGYDSLEDLLKSIKSLNVRKQSNGQVLVEANSLDMVLKQTTQKTKKKPQKTMTGIKDRQAPRRWRPLENNNCTNKNQSSTKSPRIENHNQFIKKCINNNNNNNNVIPTSKWTTEFMESGNIGKDLWNFTRFCRIAEPEIIVMERKSKPNRRLQYDCKIKVDGESLSSFPDDCYDEKSATQSASKKALDKLINKYGRTRPQNVPISKEALVKERVPHLVRKHFNGVWSWQVEADYKDAYQETLPVNWLRFFEENTMITVEQFGEKFVLRFLTGDKNKSGAITCDVSVPTSSASFDEKGFMVAKVTCPVSAGEIWCRQLNTQQAVLFDAMFKQMNITYNNNYEKQTIKPVNKDKIIKGNYYAAWNTEWQRVKVLELRKDSALCLFDDLGEDILVPYENIYILEREYARVRAQAFVCRLAGLERLYEVSQSTDAILELQDVQVTLEAVGGDDEEDAQKIFSVVMYDLDTGAACNKELLVNIAVENATHSFDLDKTFEVFVSHVGVKNLIYVQIRSAGYDAMLDLINNIVPEVRRSPKLVITRENSKDKLFLAKLENDKRYHRVRIIDSAPNFQYAQVLYVDVGNTRVVKMADAELLSLGVELRKFPPQATLVRMHLKKNTPEVDFPAMMKDLLPVEQKVLLRVQSVTNNIPDVMLFVPHANGLLSINDSLSLVSTAHAPTPPDSPHNVPSAGILQCPRLPAPAHASKEYFEVKIPFAVNPWNFFVQPLESAQLLKDTMTKLQAIMLSNKNVEPVNLKEIKPGNIYAAKYEVDGRWCRVCVLKTIYPSAIVVFYVDYGYYANLSYQDLFALDKVFLEMPYQAIKAKLAGVKPIQEKWSVDNCRYFEKLVQQREYVSVIISIEKDELYPCDNVLVLKLIDTKSSEKDVLIGNLLIQKKIAVKQ